MQIKTYGFQPRGDITEEMYAAHSRAGASVAVSDMEPNLQAFSTGLDALFARGASEAEITAYRQAHA